MEFLSNCKKPFALLRICNPHEPMERLVTQFLETPSGRKIAYNQSHSAPDQSKDKCGIIFLGGFMSDMEGSKATAFEAWAQDQGYAFLRFDYSGHGQSSGAFTDGSIGEWAEDAQAAITELTSGPQILIGSSMGGWISLLMAKRIPERIAGLVGIAAAPDFTEDSMLADFTPAQREAMQQDGVVYLPSGYGEPYPITAKLIEDGRNNLILREPLKLPFPTRLFQGTEDGSVKQSVPLKLLKHAACEDVHLTFLNGEDHSFSTSRCLGVVQDAVLELQALAALGA
jgi:pimeloyl-ACP methyl ester carboxylesterase